MPILQKITPPPTKSRNLKSRLKKDKSRGEKLFHFQLLETSSHFYLFNGNREIVKRFEKKFKKDDENGRQRQKREIRQYALALFLEFEGSQRQIGGFTYD